MSNTEMNIQFDMPKNQSNVIKVIGVGGGGSNAINYMFQQGITGVDFVVCNTDSQALENSPVPTKIQLGVNLTEGLGAGANPEIGEQAALESFEELKNLLDTNTKMVFITAGMGGGTGTGAAPIIAKQARDMEILTVGIVTIPFKFEGRVRAEQAKKGVDRLRGNVDSLIVIDNNKLREVYGNLGYKSGFAKADEVLATASRGIAEVITNHFTQNIDLHDAKTVLSNSGTAIMGSAMASGKNRAGTAILEALDSPLLNDNKIAGAKNVLLLIVSGDEEITLDEIGEISDHIQEEAGHSANIILGVGEEEGLGESISVTIIATGFSPDQQNEITNLESKKIIHTLEDDQKTVRDLSPKKSEVERRARPVDTNHGDREHQSQNRVVHDLEEEGNESDPDSEMNLVPTTALLKDLAVHYQEVAYDEEDFVFIDSDEEEREAKIKEPQEPSLFQFDLPVKNKKETRDVSNENNSRFEHTEELDADEVEVENPIEILPTDSARKEKIRRYNLGDYLEKEKELLEAKPNLSEPEPDEPHIVSQTRGPQNSQNNKKTTEEKGDLDPVQDPISQELIARATERRAKMKKFNYKFKKNKNIEEWEKQPAYKRAGVDLGQDDNSSKGDSGQFSRYTLGEENGGPHLRKNNSFLHDNVD